MSEQIIVTSLVVIKAMVPLIEQLLDPDHPRQSITREDVIEMAKAKTEEAENRVDVLLEEKDNGSSDRGD